MAGKGAGEAVIGVLGASGYTGLEALRLLARHPHAQIGPVTADSNAGRRVGDLFPQLGEAGARVFQRFGEVDWSGCDAVIACLPHGVAQDSIVELPQGVPVIDLSADFRLRDPELYESVYGRPHAAPGRLEEAVYGLTEHARDAVRTADLIACPGCYPTAALLALLPLAGGAVEADGLIVDAKSGVTGAGRALKEQNLFAEAAEGLSPYGIAQHRHAPEIEQELSERAGGPCVVSFTPHLVPMNRGELVTCYAQLAHGADAEDARAALEAAYDGEPFVHVLAPGVVPTTRMVRGSNHCAINVFADRVAGRVIVIAAIDNLVKGSSGQALQNLNLRMGWPETAGLEQLALYP